MPYVMSTCPFCGCGCGLYLQVEGPRVIGVAPSTCHPVSQGRLCVKGWHAHELATSPQRFQTPLVRHDGGLRQASWDEALGLVASRLKELQAAEGSGAVGVLGSARGTNEENYLLAKFARCCLHTNNIDFTDRLEALPGAFDLPQYRHLTTPGLRLNDLERADLILLWQSDPSQEHPAVASRIMRAAERGVPVVVVGARAGQLGSLTRYHLLPRPDTDVYLVYGLLRGAFENGRDHSPESTALAESVSDWTSERTETATGVSAALVNSVAKLIAGSHRPVVVCARAVAGWQHSTELLNGLSGLSWLANGGTPGRAVILWLGHHSNIQGARDMGVVPYFVTGYQSVFDGATRARFRSSWGVELPAEPGLASWEMLGRVRGMLVMGDDPVGHLPDAGRARAALDELDFLVAIDVFPTPTTEAADVILPGASFAEKDGTVTSADRRVQRLRRAVSPPGAARPEWSILCELSAMLGCPMRYGSPSEVLDEIAALTPLYRGISFTALETGWGIELPPIAPAAPPELNGADEETYALQHKALFSPDAEFPLVMTVDYSLQTWADDPMVRGTVALRRELGADRARGKPTVEISSSTAKELDLRSGQQVRVRSRKGEIAATIHVTDGVSPGTVVLPFAMREMAAHIMPPVIHPEHQVPMLPPCAVSLTNA
ncbi:MAG: molybdopterin oxidoreductase family protein [Armatimonadota bacterium]